MVRAIVGKEWRETLRNRMLLLPILIPVVLMTVVPILLMRLATVSGGVERSLRGVPSGVGGLLPQEAMGVLIANQIIVLFLIMPVIIPMTLAAASIIGEKQAKSLEPLLATPIETWELLAGKCLAALVPAIGLTWIAYVVFLASTAPAVGPAVRAAILGPTWLLALLLVAPLLGLLGIGIAIVISSRVNDTRVAQQFGGLIALPLVAVVVGQSAGLFLVNPATVLAAAAVLVVLDLALLRIATALFQRERILTRWR